MATTITTVAPTIDATGISAPTLPDILAYLQDKYRGIYGQDVYLGSDSQDGQFLGVLAAMINDCNSACVAVYNAFSPATGQGNGLSSTVKINGIARITATYSTVDLTISGTAGRVINNGIVEDAAGYKWNLPATVTIGTSGSVIVTATCQTAGAITAATGTVTKILTPTRGWQAVTNASAATPGQDAETDAALRQRQSVSTAIPSLSVLDGIIGAVANLTGVVRYKGYENDTNATDANGIPAHNISLVVDGGASSDIANTINQKKTPGTGTDGTTSVDVVDSKGIPNTINFYRPTDVTIQVTVNITALTGYLSTTGDALKQAIVDLINSLDIGEDVYITRLYVPANLSGSALSDTFDVTSITIGSNGGSQSAANIAIAFNEAASCVLSDVTLNVT